jgi:integrase
MAKRLTDITIRNLKERADRYEVRDAVSPLRVVVQPSGHKSFIVRYRSPIDGKPAKLTLTAGISLAAARKEAADALYEVEKRRDPSAAKKAAKAKAATAAANSFRAVAEEYLTIKCGMRRNGDEITFAGKLRTAARRLADLERLIFPAIGDRPIAEIRRREIVKLLDKIETDNGSVMADRVLAIIRSLFNWHAARDDDFRSPIVRGMARTQTQERARSRKLNDDELRAIWTTAGKTAPPFGPFVQFLLLTAARRAEAARMTWEELNGGDWILPASRNKTKKDLIRPLSAAAQGILDNLPRLADCEFVFTAGSRPFNSFSRAKTTFDAACGVAENWTLHDLRRTARSLMSRAGVNSDHAERCLGHVIGGVRGTYDRHEYYDEKKHAYAQLAALIERIANPPRGNVTALKKKRALVPTMGKSQKLSGAQQRKKARTRKILGVRGKRGRPEGETDRHRELQKQIHQDLAWLGLPYKPDLYSYLVKKLPEPGWRTELADAARVP